MLRLILDSNIYSIIAKDKDGKEIAEKIKQNENLKIYGFKLIKEEIKETPKHLKYEGHKYRALLINLYFQLIKEQYLESPNVNHSTSKTWSIC